MIHIQYTFFRLKYNKHGYSCLHVRICRKRILRRKNENKQRYKEGSVCSFSSKKLKVPKISVTKHLEMLSMNGKHINVYHTIFSIIVFQNKTKFKDQERIYLYKDDKLLFPEIPSGGSIVFL